MCICNLKINEEKLVSNGNWNTLYIERQIDGYYIVATGEGNAYMNIKYCPKCGRNLEDDKRR